MNHCLVEGGLYQTIGTGWESKIADAVEIVETPQIDVIGYLGGLGILLRYYLETHLTVEVAMIAQDGSGYRGTQFGIYPRHQDGLFAEGFCHPLGKTRSFAAIVIPYRQAEGERQTMVTAAEEGSVGGGGKGGFHFFLRLREVVVGLVVLVTYLGKTGKQLVVFRNILCH